MKTFSFIAIPWFLSERILFRAFAFPILFSFSAFHSVTSQDSPISAFLLVSPCLASCERCDNQTLWIMEMFIDEEQSSGRDKSRLSSGICSKCPHWLAVGRSSGVASQIDKFEVLFVSLWLANTEVSAYHSNASLISVEFIWLAFSNWILNWFSNICHPTQPRKFQFAVCLRFKWIPEASKTINSKLPLIALQSAGFKRL